MDNEKIGSWFDPRKLIKPRVNPTDTEVRESTLALMEAILKSQNEQEILSSGIEYLVERCDLSGASFIPFNEMKAIAPPIFVGEIGDPKLFKLDNYIELVDLRQECKRCVEFQADSNCVLLADGSKFQIKCVNLVISGKKEGVINFYWSRTRTLEEKNVELIDRVIAILEQGVEQIELKKYARKTMNTSNETSESTDVLSMIEKSIKSICEAHQVDSLYGYFPEGFKEPNDKLIQIINPVSQSITIESFSEMVDGIWKIIQNTGEMVFIENKNQDHLWNQILAFPIGNQEQPEKLPEGMIVLLTHQSSLAPAQHDTTFRVVFEQIGQLLLKERALSTVYERSMTDERIRLSREIHDGIAQTLAFLMIQMKRMWRFYQQNETVKFVDVYDESYQIVSDTYGDLRDAIHDLRRTPETDLIETIKELCGEFADKTGIETIVELQPIEGHSSSQFQLHLIRIFQEALSNIRKHSQASEVRVIGETMNGSYRFQVFDDGVGFDSKEKSFDRTNHFGLTSIHERARILGITANIDSAPGQGTCLELRL